MTQIKYVTQCIKNKGSMAWEYNPLYNFRKGDLYLKNSEGNYLSADRNILSDVITWDLGKVNKAVSDKLKYTGAQKITSVTTHEKRIFEFSSIFKKVLKEYGYSDALEVNIIGTSDPDTITENKEDVEIVDENTSEETTENFYYSNSVDDFVKSELPYSFGDIYNDFHKNLSDLGFLVTRNVFSKICKNLTGNTVSSLKMTSQKNFLKYSGLSSVTTSTTLKLFSIKKEVTTLTKTTYSVPNYTVILDGYINSSILNSTSIDTEYLYGIGILDLYAAANKIVTEVSGDGSYHFVRNGKYYKCLDNKHRDYDENGNIIGVKHIDSDIYPLVYETDGIIEDLITGGNGEEDVLNFDLHHPVEIECQLSYDGSTNLILNDNKNLPRLINTRFTPLELNTYERVDRKGNTDTNLYDNTEFELDTSLTKRYLHIPVITFGGLTYGGLLKVGMYTFYFKLADADGNETDVVAESGCIPVYIGNINTPLTIRGGLQDENAYKGISFIVTNIDTAYDYLVVYYSRNSSNADALFGQTTYYKIDDKYRIMSGSCSFIVTGAETTSSAGSNDIIVDHQIYSRARTQALCLNMLFMGNVTKPKIDYDELLKLSLEFLPFYLMLSCDTLIGYPLYDGEDAYGIGGYYNANSVYNYVGYWPEEIYRFGVVYIMDDGSLSPVFNIRGIGELTNIKDVMVSTNTPSPFYSTEWEKQPTVIKKLDTTGKIEECSKNNPFTERDTFTIDYDTNWINKLTLENSAGVVRFPSEQIATSLNQTEELWEYSDGTAETIDPKVSEEYKTKSTTAYSFGNPIIYGLAIKVGDDVIKELREKHHVKGHFIVRQKRIPTILAQAFTEGYDETSGTPIIRINHQNDYTEMAALYCSETFLKTDATLPVNDDEDIDDADTNPLLISWPTKTKKSYKTTDYSEALLDTPKLDVLTAFCPEFELNLSYYNSVFSGGEFPVKNVTDSLRMVTDESNDRFMYCSWNLCWKKPEKNVLEKLKIISIPDNTPLIRNDGYNFRARCGEAEDVSFISCVPKERYVVPTASNYVSYKKKKARFKKWLKIIACAVAVVAAVAVSVVSFGTAAPVAAIGASATIAALTTTSVVATTATVIGVTAATIAAAVGIGTAVGAAFYGVSLAWAGPATAHYERHSAEGYTPLKSAIIRGSYGSYLGLSGNKNLKPSEIVNIYVPGNDLTSDYTKFNIRINDQQPYYAVTERTEYHDYVNQYSLLSYTDSRGNTRTMNDSVIPVFRGDCYISNFTHRLNRNFNDSDAPYNDIIVDKNTWKNNWKGTADHADVNRGDINAVKLGLWVTFPIRSSMNLCYRDTDSTYVNEYAACGIPRGFYPFQEISVAGNHKIPESQTYNPGFSTSTGIKPYFTNATVPYLKNNFLTRIAYSAEASTDAFRNGYREFNYTAYKDYPLLYGGLMKLVEFSNKLIAVFEHGVGMIQVNLLALMSVTDELKMKLAAGDVMSEITMLSTDYGTQWPESVCVTDSAVYGVDTVDKKIWRINSSGFELISDFKVLKFLNDNITLEERETDPIIGVRNVKTHYNANKKDVMFTYYDNTIGFEEKAWNLCYNEYLGKFTTFYSWIPGYSQNIHNIYFSYDRNSSKWITNLGMSIADVETQPKTALLNALTYTYFDEYDAFNTDAQGSCVKSVLMDEWEKCVIVDDCCNNVTCYRTPLYLQNKYFPTGKDIWVKYKFTVERDNFGNFKYFFTTAKIDEEVESTEDNTHKDGYYNYGESYLYITEENLLKLRYKMLKEVPLKPVIQLNIKCLMSAINTTASALGSYDVKRSEKYVSYNAGYFESLMCLTFSEVTSLKEVEFASGTCELVDTLKPTAYDSTGTALTYLTVEVDFDRGLVTTYDKNPAIPTAKVLKTSTFNATYPKLRTDFWKHGQAGLMNDVEKIKPCMWYGKQHPFEIDFVVGADDGLLKQFLNFVIFSNNVLPESIHLTIKGDEYDFAKDKRNMYLRQEATKAFYQLNGSDILYDHSPFKDSDFMNDVKPVLINDFIEVVDNNVFLRNKSALSTLYKATLLPLIYSKQDTFNEIEDFYKKAVNHNSNIDYQNYSGGEVIFNETEDSFSICNHQLIRDIEYSGRTRGNAQYSNGYWSILIQPLNIYQKNETINDWYNKDSSHIVPPISVGNVPVPEDFNPLLITVGNDGKTYIADKTVDESLIRDGKDEFVVNANTKTTNTSLKGFVPSDVYAYYKDTSQLDLTPWNKMYNNKKNISMIDTYMRTKIRWPGDKLVLLKAVQTVYNTY